MSKAEIRLVAIALLIWTPDPPWPVEGYKMQRWQPTVSRVYVHSSSRLASNRLRLTESST